MHGHVKGGARAREDAAHKDKAESKKTAAQKALIASLFKGVTQVQMAADGETVDLKRTLCGFFKAGVCEKGKKCKYSHDMSLAEAKTASIDIY